jgi:Ca2+-binding EF-hand superfamily protein
MRFKCFFLLIGLALVVGPAAGLSWSDSDSGAADLGARWKQLAGRGEVWRRADISDPHQRFIYDLVADKLNSTDGQITRDQFLQMPQRLPAGSPADGPAKDAEQLGEPTSDAPPPAAPPEAGIDVGPQAEAAFRQMDTNGDGVLDYDEMDDGLRAERDKWDANGDGFIDLAEFKEYYKARLALFRQAARRAPPAPPPAKGNGKMGQKVAERMPDPFAPELPPGLPDWFRQYDTDGDGQIGLYEWKAAGQPIAKFLEMDLNRDGFLTPDEVLWATGASAAPKEPKH